ATYRGLPLTKKLPEQSGGIDLAVGKAEGRRPVVLVRASRPRHARSRDCVISRPKEAQRNAGVVVPHADVERQVLRGFDVVLKKVILVRPARIKRRFIDGLDKGKGPVVHEILKVVERPGSFRVRSGSVEELVVANVEAEFQTVTFQEIRGHVLPLVRVG